MTQKEQTRLQVLDNVLAGQVPVCQAAEVLGVSERHMRRILAAYRKEGAAALAHGNRGRRPANTTVDDQDLYTIVITTYIPPRQVGDGPWTPWYADYYHPAV